jgi:hypothetical protein
MATGASSTKISAILNLHRATNITAPTTEYIKLHIGDPGAAGTANPSAVTTRNAITFVAPASNQITLSALANYTMTATETISHVSIWDAASAGNFQESYALTATVPVVNATVLSFSVFTLGILPVAA